MHEATGDAATPVAAGPRVVLFDFDGVLVRGDAFTAFITTRIRRSPWRFALFVLVGLPLAPLWLLRRARIPLLRIFVRIGLLGTSLDAYQTAARAFAQEFAQRPRSFIRAGISAYRRHLQAGDRVIIVTGCEWTLADALLGAIGLGGMEIIASRLGPGRLGVRALVHNLGATKLQELARHGIQPPWAVAYSDSARDIPMLRGATEAVVVNVTPERLRRIEAALEHPPRAVAWR